MRANDGVSERYDFLDWLRVIAIFVLLFYHTGMIFVGWGWHIVNAQTIPSLEIPMAIFHRLRMPLLFVISGAGMWFALQSRRSGQVLRERTLRLLVPLAIGVFLVVPPQIYYERLLRGQWDGGYPDFYLTRVLQFHIYPHGDFSWHHLWFIAYLYVYVLLLMPVLVWWKRHAASIAPGRWMYLLALPLCANEVLLHPLFPEANNLVHDWYVFTLYLLLTVFGYLIASVRDSWQWLAEHRVPSMVAALATLTLVLSLLLTDAIAHGSWQDSVIANLFMWTSLLAFIGYGYRHLSFVNPMLRWAREASYPVYIMHQTIIVAIGYFVIQTSWAPWTKFFVIVSATMAVCFVLYQGCIRWLNPIRVAFGMKPFPAARPTAETPARSPFGWQSVRVPDDVQ